jgi:hypothetical protein
MVIITSSIKVKLVVKRISPIYYRRRRLFHVDNFIPHKSLLSLVITGTSGNDDGMY